MDKFQSKELRDEIREDLNKILLKLANVGDLTHNDEYYDEYSKQFKETQQYWGDDEEEEDDDEEEEDDGEPVEKVEFDDNLTYLKAVKGYVTRAVKKGDCYYVLKNEEKYYTSTCWG